ncbi:MAG: type IV pilus secretin PilQ [bacterium]|nr:type IV pilus secretin PilQ [bacterium]
MRGKYLCFAGVFLMLMAMSVQADDSVRLNSINWEGTTLVLDMSSECEYRTMTLDDPYRLVIDFPGMKSGLRVHSFTGEGEIEGIRVGQNYEDDDSGVRCRIVLDMKSEPRFSVDQAGGTYRVMFDYSHVVELSDVGVSDAPATSQFAMEETATPDQQVVAPVRTVAESREPAVTAPEPETSKETTKILQASGAETSLLGFGESMKVPSREELQALAERAKQPTTVESVVAEDIQEPAPLEIGPDEDRTAQDEAEALTPEPGFESELPTVEKSETIPEKGSAAEDVSVLDDDTDLYSVAAPLYLETDIQESAAAKSAPPLLGAGMGNLPSLPTKDERESGKTTHEREQSVMPAPVQKELTFAEAVETEEELQAQKMTAVPTEDEAVTIEAETKPAPAVVEVVEKGKPAPDAEAAKQVPALLTAGMATPSGAVTEQASGKDEQEPAPEKALQVAKEPEQPAAGVAVKIINAKTEAASVEKKTVDENIARQARLSAARKSSTDLIRKNLKGEKPLDAPISIEMRGAEFKTLLRAFATFSGRNIISGKEVKGQVSVQLTSVPWFEGLKAVCQANGYGVVEEYGMLRIAPLAAINMEEMERLSNSKKRIDYEPLITKVISLNFAKSEDLREPLMKMLSDRGKMETETRTNSLLVTDIPANIEMILKMAAELDIPMPQVEITARLVDIDYKASRDLGVRWEALNLASNNTAGMGGSAVIDGSFPTPVGEFKLGTIRNWGDFNVTLQAMERDNTANIISNPRVMTMDNMQASILVGKKVPLIVADEAGNAVTQMTTVGIKLTVTPHINPDGQIMMELATEVSDLSSEATVQGGVIITTHESKTNVMVNNGNTAVIAGLIRTSGTDLNQGVPLLSKVPLVGRLFGYQNEAKEKRELIIFITPRIMSVTEAAGETSFEDYNVEWPTTD